jgi:hypothetical protein
LSWHGKLLSMSESKLFLILNSELFGDMTRYVTQDVARGVDIAWDVTQDVDDPWHDSGRRYDP